MITVSVKQLMEAIEDAQVYKMPEMKEGTGYLFRTVYSRMANGESVCLSDLDFNAFDETDLEEIDNLHNNVFERFTHQSGQIRSAIKKMSPVTTVSRFV